MSTGLGVVWITPPTALLKAIEQYGAKVLVAVHAVADFIAQRLQDDARRDAPWTDRTGNARSGLFSLVDDAAEKIVSIYLAHTMDYGVFLELANGGRYAVIMKTIEKDAPLLKQMLDELFAE